MCSNDADGMANSVDSDQTAPSALFAQICLSENLGTLRYDGVMKISLFCDKRMLFSPVLWAPVPVPKSRKKNPLCHEAAH